MGSQLHQMTLRSPVVSFKHLKERCQATHKLTVRKGMKRSMRQTLLATKEHATRKKKQMERRSLEDLAVPKKPSSLFF